MRRIKEYDTKHINTLLSLVIFAMSMIILICSICIVKGVAQKTAPNEAKYNKDPYSQIVRKKYNSKIKPDDESYYDYGVLYSGEGEEINKSIKSFYSITGVTAFYEFYNDLATYIQSTDYENVDEYVSERYSSLFSDSEHLLIIFDNMTNNIYVTSGSKIKDVIDDEAEHIIKDYLASALSDEDKANIDYGNAFGKCLTDAAARIMYKRLSFFEKNTAMLTVIILCSIIMLAAAILMILIYIALHKY